MKINKLNILILSAILPFSFGASAIQDLDPLVMSKISDKAFEYKYIENRTEIVNFINIQIDKAGSLKRLISNAENGDGVSNYAAYKMYKYGIAHDVDFNKAFHYLLASAESNYPEAKLDLGMYFLDYNIGDKYSASISEHALSLFAPKESFENETLNHEALATKVGFALIKDAALLGNEKAQYIIGINYINGQHIARDYDLGLFWLSRSNNAGYAPAWEARSKLLDYATIQESFDKAQRDAKNGSDDALVKLAQFYIDGFVVQGNRLKAINLLNAAASMGNQKAEEMLIKLK